MTYQLQDTVAYLDSLFVDCQPQKDYSNNGLQIEACEACRKVAFAVDVCQDTLQMAVEAGADLLFAHHGLSWGNGFARLTGMDARRFGFAFQNHLSVYAMHLPLDAHPELGNNAVLARELGLLETQAYFDVRGLRIGMYGRLPQENSLAELSSRVKALCGQAGGFRNRNRIRTVGIVSGSAGDAIPETARLGLDCLITGEAHHQDFHTAEENGISVLMGGHYATETFGVKAVMQKMADELGLETVFLDCPTGF